MKKLTLALSAMFFSFFGMAQTYQDTLINLEGKTTVVQILEFAPDHVSYRLESSPEVTFIVGRSTLKYVGFANPEVEDWEAPRNLIRNESFYILGGVRTQDMSEGSFAFATMGIGADFFWSENWGFSLQTAFGPSLMVNSNTNFADNYMNFGISAIWRSYAPGGRWSSQLELGLFSNTIGMASFSEPYISTLNVRFTPSIYYTTKFGLEIGLSMPVDLNGRDAPSFEPQIRIGYRF